MKKFLATYPQSSFSNVRYAPSEEDLLAVQVAQEWMRRADQASQRAWEPEEKTVRPAAPGGAWPSPTGGLPALGQGGS